MVILLAGLFIAAIVLAITGAPVNQLMAVIFSIVFISVLFYAMGLMTRVLKRDESKSRKKINKFMTKQLPAITGSCFFLLKFTRGGA